MKIGLILPSLVAANRYKKRIFALKELLVSLADGLVKGGHQVFVYGSSDIKTQAKLFSFSSFLENRDYLSIQDIYKGYSQGRSSVRVFNEYEIGILSRAIVHANKEKVDILHDYLGYLGQYFTGFSNVPMVFTLHDPIFSKDTLEYQRIKQFPNNNYIAISYDQKEEYEQKAGITCVGVVHHGLNLDDFTFSDKPLEHMVFFGRFIEAKGVTYAIAAAKITKIPLRLASSKNYRDTNYYREKIKPEVDSKLIVEEDFLGPKARSLFLQKAKVSLFPVQWSEPFGMTLIESMACGTPVVAYGRGSVREIIKDGESGFVVDPDEGLSGFCRAIKKIYALPKEKYIAMRKNCRRHVEDNFTVEKMVEGYEDIYRKVILLHK